MPSPSESRLLLSAAHAATAPGFRFSFSIKLDLVEDSSVKSGVGSRTRSSQFPICIFVTSSETEVSSLWRSRALAAKPAMRQGRQHERKVSSLVSDVMWENHLEPTAVKISRPLSPPGASSGSSTLRAALPSGCL